MLVSWFSVGGLWPKQLFAAGPDPGLILLQALVTLCLAGYLLPKGKDLFPPLKLLCPLSAACPHQGGRGHEQALAPALGISMHVPDGPIGQPGVALSDVTVV